MVDKLIDRRDKQILFELDFNSRKSLSDIAKKVKLSKQSVAYRINRMTEKKILLGFYPMINLTKLGYYYGRVFLKLQNLTKEKEEELIKYIVKHPKTRWVIKAEGSYDLLFAIWTKTQTEFKEIVDSFVSVYGANIKEKRLSIGLAVHHFQNRYILQQKESEEIILKEETEISELDAIDVKIIEILSEDARISLVELSNKLKMTPKGAFYRLNQLIKNKILLGTRPIINNNLLGWTHYKIFFYFKNITKEESSKFIATLKHHPNVVYIVNEIGICDVDVEVMFRTNMEFLNFLKTLKYEFPKLIKEYESFIMFETLKIVYSPF